MEVEKETSSSSSSTIVIGDLVASLEQATLMAKHLPTTADPSHLLQIRAALHAAHHHLSLFLSHHHPPPPLPENSVSSAVCGGGEEPMQMGDDVDEQNSRAAANVNKVEERMRECSVRSKRAKRRLSPSSAAERRCGDEDEARRGGDAAGVEFDPVGTKLRSLDLIYQFHA